MNQKEFYPEHLDLLSEDDLEVIKRIFHSNDRETRPLNTSILTF